MERKNLKIILVSLSAITHNIQIENGVGYIDNCAVRTTNALRAGGISVMDPYNTAGFPEGIRRAINYVPGVVVNIEKNGPVSSFFSHYDYAK